jgi:succinate-semialdehyde dehydrogenase
VNATNDGVSQAINDPRIAAVTVTGSVRAGAAIGAQAGAALKKCVLELGGSDPFIVLNDADLDLAVKAAVAGRYQNTGQVCAAAKRFIVEAGIADAFTEKFIAAAAALPQGEPLDETPTLARWRVTTCAMSCTHRYWRLSVRGNPGAWRRETFGGRELLSGNRADPCDAGDDRFSSGDVWPGGSHHRGARCGHALELANDSDFGLSATVFTADMALAEDFAARLECGGVFINGYSASDARVAFGGVKKSGFGRELSHFGCTSFVMCKPYGKIACDLMRALRGAPSVNVMVSS